MRTIKQLAIPQDTDLGKFPEGTILNETEGVEGTPIIREIYGDVLTNIYKILSETKEVPTGIEDSETAQFQIVNALKKWSNDLNDKEQVLSLTTTVWSVTFDISIVPDKYVFLARASDNFNPLVSYTFKGSEAAPSFPLSSSTGFNASDEILVVIDQTGVRVISLTMLSTTSNEIFTTLGPLLPFNDTSVVKYEIEGSILDDTPSIVDLRSQIRIANTDALSEVYDMVILKGFVLCWVFLPGTITYELWQFDLLDLNTAIQVPITGIVVPVGSDNQPFLYTDGTVLYITNASGTAPNDHDVSFLSYTPATPNASFISNNALNIGFQKTSNVVIQGTDLFTFVNSVLKKYGVVSGVETIVDDFKTTLGTIFKFDGDIYYTNGEVSKKWTI